MKNLEKFEQDCEIANQIGNMCYDEFLERQEYGSYEEEYPYQDKSEIE